MKVTTLEQIERHLKVGCFVVVKHLRDDEYLVVTPVRDRYGDWRDSGWHRNIESCKPTLGIEVGNAVVGWLGLIKDGLEIVEVFRLEPEERFKEGGEVMYDGERYKVIDISNNHYQIKRNNDLFSIGGVHHSELTYPLDEEPEMTKEEALREIERLKKYINK